MFGLCGVCPGLELAGMIRGLIAWKPAPTGLGKVQTRLGPGGFAATREWLTRIDLYPKPGGFFLLGQKLGRNRAVRPHQLGLLGQSLANLDHYAAFQTHAGMPAIGMVLILAKKDP